MQVVFSRDIGHQPSPNTRKISHRCAWGEIAFDIRPESVEELSVLWGALNVGKKNNRHEGDGSRSEFAGEEEVFNQEFDWWIEERLVCEKSLQAE